MSSRPKGRDGARALQQRFVASGRQHRSIDAGRVVASGCVGFSGHLGQEKATSLLETTVGTTHPGEAAGEDAAVEVGAQLSFNERGKTAPVLAALAGAGEERLHHEDFDRMLAEGAARAGTQLRILEPCAARRQLHFPSRRRRRRRGRRGGRGGQPQGGGPQPRAGRRRVGPTSTATRDLTSSSPDWRARASAAATGPRRATAASRPPGSAAR